MTNEWHKRPTCLEDRCRGVNFRLGRFPLESANSLSINDVSQFGGRLAYQPALDFTNSATNGVTTFWARGLG